MSAFVCGCDPEASYTCERFQESRDCAYAVAQSLSQQSRGWYLLMLDGRLGTDENARFLHVRDNAPEGQPRVFWSERENSAFRFPTPEAARIAQENAPDGADAWVIYRSH